MSSPLLINALNKLHCNIYMLYANTLACHWDVRGENFSSLHALFGTQYDALKLTLDGLAEKIRYLGGFPTSKLSEVVTGSDLQEYDADSLTALNMVKLLHEDNVIIVNQIRKLSRVLMENYQEDSIVDFILGVQHQLEQASWILRSHLE